MNGESGVAFALDTKLLHPRPKAMGVELQFAVFETGRNFRFLTLAWAVKHFDKLFLFP